MALSANIGAWRANISAERVAGWLAPIGAWLMPVLVAALTEHIFRHAAWGLGEGLHDLAVARWDALNYLSIAQHGYVVSICPAGYKYAGKLCGTVGWYPGWPLLLALIAKLGMPFPLDQQAWILDLALALAGFALLYRFLRRFAPWPVAAWGLVAAALFPGSFYWLTAFPYGLILALTAGYLLTYERYPVGAALLLAALSLTYPQACIVALVPITIWALPHLARAWRAVYARVYPWLATHVPWRIPTPTTQIKPPEGMPWRHAALVALPSAFGPLAMIAWFQYQFHNPFVYYEFQSRYGWHVSLPFALIQQDVRQHGYLASATLTIVTGLVIYAAFASRAKPLPFVVYGLAGLFGFLCLGTIRSTPRYDLLLPTALWIATARVTWWRVAIILLMAWASLYVCQDYFHGTLI